MWGCGQEGCCTFVVVYVWVGVWGGARRWIPKMWIHSLLQPCKATRYNKALLADECACRGSPPAIFVRLHSLGACCCELKTYSSQGRQRRATGNRPPANVTKAPEPIRIPVPESPAARRITKFELFCNRADGRPCVTSGLRVDQQRPLPRAT